MKITFVVPIANRRRGDVADLDDASATLLITQQFATPTDDTSTQSTKDDAPARPRRARRAPADPPSRRVGDDPSPAGQDPGTS